MDNRSWMAVGGIGLVVLGYLTITRGEFQDIYGFRYDFGAAGSIVGSFFALVGLAILYVSWRRKG